MSGWYLFNFFFQKEETDIGVDGEDEDQNGRPYDKFDNCSCLKDDQFLLQVQWIEELTKNPLDKTINATVLRVTSSEMQWIPLAV